MSNKDYHKFIESMNMTTRSRQLLNLDFWIEYLFNLGYEVKNQHEWKAGDNGEFGEYCEFYYGDYIFKLDLWHFNPTQLVFVLSGPDIKLKNESGSESILIELDELSDKGMDLLTVLKAIVDPSQAPLCIHIDWAKPFIDRLLTTLK